MARTSSFRGRLLKESNSNQCCGDKGGVVLAESTVTLLSLGKLRRLTPDACSPKPQRIGSFQVERAPGKRLWSHTTSPPLLGKSPNLDFSHLKNGDNDTYFRGLLGKGSGTTSVHSRCSINSLIFSNFEHTSNFRTNPSQKKQLPRVPKKTRTQKRTHFVLFWPFS